MHLRIDDEPLTSTTIGIEYCRRTPRSRAFCEAARRVLPGGDTRTVTHFSPYPVFMKEGRGCRVVDVDENRYLDLVNNYTSLIHGHSHSDSLKAVVNQGKKGWCFAAPHELQVDLAQLLCERMPSLEQVRFCNSGTEATMAAIRAAKTFTGRNKILKMEGGYHGSHDAAEVSVNPPLAEAGPVESPTSRAECEGLFRGVLADVLVAPFNDVEATAHVLERHSDDIAAIIVEPIMGHSGTVPATSRFLRFLRSVSAQCGALLILDEIISFRLAYGGAQEIYGVQPDLTTLGKIIGGGLPIGAFGGRSDVMALFDPRNGRLFHSGTFNGNALSMAAGISTLRSFTRDEIERVNELGEALRGGLRKSFSAQGIPGKVTGMGSLAAWHFTSSEVVDYRGVARANRSLHHPFHLALLNRGIFTMPRGSACISTPMQAQEIEEMIVAFDGSLREITGLNGSFPG